MLKTTKRIISVVCSLAMLLCSMTPAVLAEDTTDTKQDLTAVVSSRGSSYYDFSDDIRAPYNGKGMSEGVTYSIESGIGGKGADDKSATVRWTNVDATAGFTDNSPTITYAQGATIGNDADTTDAWKSDSFTVGISIYQSGVDSVKVFTRPLVNGKQTDWMNFATFTSSGTGSFNGVDGGNKAFTFNPGIWNRLSVNFAIAEVNGEFYPQYTFYLNGTEIAKKTFSSAANALSAYKTYGINYLQIRADVNATETPFTGHFAIDDLEGYDGAFVNDNTTLLPMFDSADNNIHFAPAIDNKIFVRSGITAEDFAAATADILAKNYTSGETVVLADSTGAAKTTGKIVDGDKLVVSTADGKYTSAYNITTDFTVKSTDFSSAPTLGFSDTEFNAMTPGENTFGSYVEYLGTFTEVNGAGLFGKADDDVAIGVYGEDIPNLDGTLARHKNGSSEYKTPLINTPPRLNLQSGSALGGNVLIGNTGSFESNDYTIQMKIAYTGDIDSAKLYAAAFVTPGTGNLNNRSSLNQIVEIDTNTGIATISGSTSESIRKVEDIIFKPDRWYTVAMSMHPSTSTFDLYINGILEGEGLPVSAKNIDENTRCYGFNWISAKAACTYHDELLNTPRSGAMYVDDCLVYIGSYVPSESAQVTASDYVVDQQNGYIAAAGDDLENLLGSDIDFGDATPVILDYDGAAVEEGTVEEGYTLINTSSDGEIIEYYDFVPKTNEFSINVYADEYPGESAAAYADIYSPVGSAADAANATLVLALYEGGSLKAMKLDNSGSFKGYMSLVAEYADTTITDDTVVKAFVVDGFSNIRPLAVHVVADGGAQ